MSEMLRIKDGWIYECVDSENPMSPRFVLGQITKETKNPLICFGVNPSTAIPDDLDRTLARVKNISEAGKRFDGWIMFNLYPQRATNPKDIHNQDSFDEQLHQQNLKEIRKVFSSYSKLTVWAAWGGVIRKRAFLKERCLVDILESIKPYSVEWKHRGELTLMGDPRHPSRLKKNLSFYSFDFDKYFEINR